ncbi:helix-turn-helix domain-containing protein [Thermobifida halotolerans]|uniref:Helix-turn-helix domain-containing protein n=1 Tax=Thermobifida halotolerans TaxID=483545 RepID=A0A399G664_9ACTN|nr:helix-turn-helix domain-containing protein [Thermobifida halotolerans]UOE20751.1 helix-turn-helix domain-containing protein [Thermobifida halotolerans]
MNLAELAAFLKSRRDRVRPADVGLTAGPRRRVPGLRREEVALLAGASVDYCTELERGRGAQPSPQMLADLHAVAARRGGADVHRMVAELRRRSAESADLWDTRAVALRRRRRKRLCHPELGIAELDCHNLFSEDGRQRLLFFTEPAGGPAARQLELLSVIGVRDPRAGQHIRS